ncbi:MAG: Hsp20/alpha crystallin family protein [Candidatus Micrarchaeia archaeon]
MLPERWDPYRDMRRMREIIDGIFEDFLNPEYRMPSRRLAAFREPVLDLADTGDAIVAKIEMPGVRKEDIHVSVQGDRLEVKAERKEEREESKGGHYYKERSYAGFYRLIPLPAEIDQRNVKAKYSDGVLEITMKKAKQEKGTEIKIE